MLGSSRIRQSFSSSSSFSMPAMSTTNSADRSFDRTQAGFDRSRRKTESSTSSRSSTITISERLRGRRSFSPARTSLYGAINRPSEFWITAQGISPPSQSSDRRGRLSATARAAVRLPNRGRKPPGRSRLSPPFLYSKQSAAPAFQEESSPSRWRLRIPNRKLVSCR
jgi:hypothetical protein